MYILAQEQSAVKTLSCFALNQGQRVDRWWARSHPLDSPALLDTIRRRCKRCHGLQWTHTCTDSVYAPYCLYRVLYIIRSLPASMSTVPRLSADARTPACGSMILHLDNHISIPSTPSFLRQPPSSPLLPLLLEEPVLGTPLPSTCSLSGPIRVGI